MKEDNHLLHQQYVNIISFKFNLHTLTKIKDGKETPTKVKHT